MHDDVTLQLYGTAQMTAINNQRQQLNRQVHAQGDAEDRAFHAERELLRMKQAHENEQREHALTQAAMVRLLADNIGMQKILRYLAERWAAGEPYNGVRAARLSA